MIAFSFPLPDAFLNSGRKEKTQKKSPDFSFQARGDLENPQKPVGKHFPSSVFDGFMDELALRDECNPVPGDLSSGYGITTGQFKEVVIRIRGPQRFPAPGRVNRRLSPGRLRSNG
ncbi:hypothetical protein LptCag_1875 [Leptospirillum ferriphilum]|uniref:Uncharacterized protein n=1 Tax=Leptospirillum ferriphilum TaxID=178606 RepID=A0A094W9K1_9BACT|nr:hypothetical protein LptCag_1875 [Leptospirillum ferriphilum]